MLASSRTPSQRGSCLCLEAFLIEPQTFLLLWRCRGPPSKGCWSAKHVRCSCRESEQGANEGGHTESISHRYGFLNRAEAAPARRAGSHMVGDGGAAETAGGWEQHQTNSLTATEQVLSAAASAGVRRVIHVSSISVLRVPARGQKLSEATAIEVNSRTGGPYAWGKIESERLAVSRCAELGIELRVVRPSALVDYRHFDPPGLLGKRVGNIFVAVGMPGNELGVVDVVFSAQTLAWMIRHFEDAPSVLNLFEPQLPTKRELLARLRRTNPSARRTACRSFPRLSQGASLFPRGRSHEVGASRLHYGRRRVRAQA